MKDPTLSKNIKEQEVVFSILQKVFYNYARLCCWITLIQQFAYKYCMLMFFTSWPKQNGKGDPRYNCMLLYQGIWTVNPLKICSYSAIQNTALVENNCNHVSWTISTYLHICICTYARQDMTFAKWITT